MLVVDLAGEREHQAGFEQSFGRSGTRARLSIIRGGRDKCALTTA
jgi:hypothetical protein